MTDAVLPENVFPPAIAMVGGDHGVASQNLPTAAPARHPHAPGRRVAGGGRYAAAHDWAAEKEHRDCRLDPRKHRHANRARGLHVQKQQQRLLREYICAQRLDPGELFS